MIRYEIREICGDWAIYEVRETETEGGEKCLLILNSRSNAEYIKAILAHEAKDPNAAVPYRPEVAQMSDEEVLAVSRMCTSYEVWACDKCPLKGRDVCREEINRRVLEMAEKYLEHENTISFHEKLKEITREAAGQTGLSASAQWMIRQQEMLQDKAGRLEGWISVEERLPQVTGKYICCVKDKGENTWTVPADWILEMKMWFGEFGEIKNMVTHWMPLPEAPMMKGGE